MDKKEFEFRKKLIEMEHKGKMEWAKYIRETERLKHEWEKERQRIRSAEIRKTQERRERRKDFEWVGKTAEEDLKNG